MTVHVSTDNGIATVTLDRPEVLNAIDREMRLELESSFGWLEADPEVRAIVLTGVGGRAFTAGQDLNELVDFDGPAGADWVRSLGRLYQSLRDLSKGCVVAIDGIASGAGLQMALHADVRVATPRSRFTQPEINAGLPSVLGPWVMREAIGFSRTREMALSGRIVDATEARLAGMIDDMAEPDDLMPHALALAEGLAAMPATAVALTRRRMREATQAGWDATIEAGARLAEEAFADGEPQRTARAFIEARRRRRAER